MVGRFIILAPTTPYPLLPLRRGVISKAVQLKKFTCLG